MLVRAFDLVVAAVLLVVLAPLFAIIAAAIRVDSEGPVLFRQTRVGLRGRPFRIVKFRTMRHGASVREAHDVICDVNTYVYAAASVVDDRVTRVGRLLRATSLDELPQLVNVLRGEMSLVGPRPDLPELVAQYPPEYGRRHDVRPGITGLAQVSGRADLSYGEMLAYDLDYVDHHPLSRNLEILLKTVGVVIRRKGAR